MEVRVTPALVPSIQERSAALPPSSARADAAALGPFRNFVCNVRETGREEKLSVRRLIHRNAAADMALARALEASSQGDLRAEALRRASAGNRTAWCQAPLAAGEWDSEWFLRVRDLLYRKAGAAPD
jgi:hypothetical protein